MNLQEKGAEMCLKKGMKEIESKAKKYRVFESAAPGKFIFIGKQGAIRTGKNISSSFSIGRVK